MLLQECMGRLTTAAGYEAVFKGKFHMVKKAQGPDGQWQPSDVGQYAWKRWNSPVSMCVLSVYHDSIFKLLLFQTTTSPASR